MICAIHQPNYLPFPGFFDKALNSDIFIIYDTTQFRKNNYQNRNRLCCANGWQWITVPVTQVFGRKINEVEIFNPAKALKNNWSTIQTIYGNAPYFKDYSDIFAKVYKKNYSYIADLNCDLIFVISSILGIKTKFIRSSSLPKISSMKTQALVDLCKKVNADVYLSGSSGEDYLDRKLFADSGIELSFQKYQHPVYKQFNNNEFQPYMSVIDLIFNCGGKGPDVISGKRN